MLAYACVFVHQQTSNRVKWTYSEFTKQMVPGHMNGLMHVSKLLVAGLVTLVFVASVAAAVTVCEYVKLMKGPNELGDKAQYRLGDFRPCV